MELKVNTLFWNLSAVKLKRDKTGLLKQFLRGTNLTRFDQFEKKFHSIPAKL